MKKKTKLLIKDAFLSTILSCLLLLILSYAFISIRFFNPLQKAFSDFSFLDVYYSERFDSRDKINNKIVLVNIENHDRAVIAELLDAILKEKPDVVGFDIILEERPEKTPADSLLAQLLQHKKVVTAIEIKENKLLENDPFFDTTHQPGFVNFNFDKNTAVIRDFIGITHVYGKERHSFATKIAKKYLKKRQWKKHDYDDKLSELQTINYTGNYEAFPYLEVEDFVLSDTKPILKDKIVILGYLGSPTGNTFDIQDKFFTPLNPTLAGKSDADMFGVVIHANIVSMIVNHDFMHKVSLFWIFVITFICMFLSTLLYIKFNKKYKISYRTRKQVYQLVFSIGLFALVIWLFKHDIVLSPFPILVGVIMAGSYFKYYKQLVRYIKTKRKWKSYIK